MSAELNANRSSFYVPSALVTSLCSSIQGLINNFTNWLIDLQTSITFHLEINLKKWYKITLCRYLQSGENIENIHVMKRLIERRVQDKLSQSENLILKEILSGFRLWHRYRKAITWPFHMSHSHSMQDSMNWCVTDSMLCNVQITHCFKFSVMSRLILINFICY